MHCPGKGFINDWPVHPPQYSVHDLYYGRNGLLLQTTIEYLQ